MSGPKASNDLVWSLIRNTSSFRVKRGRADLSRQPGNSAHIHSKAHTPLNAMNINLANTNRGIINDKKKPSNFVQSMSSTKKWKQTGDEKPKTVKISKEVDTGDMELDDVRNSASVKAERARLTSAAKGNKRRPRRSTGSTKSKTEMTEDE